MPPEQVNPRRGDATVLPTTDLFSFGVMMFQLITGVLPFGSLKNEDSLYQYVTRLKSENWDREILKNKTSWQNWIPLIESCLKADFHSRIQSVDLALSLVPQSRLSSFVQNEVAPIIPQFKSGYALRVMQGEEYGKIYKLNELIKFIGKRVLTIGRDDEDTRNTIPIKETESSYISRKHCTLEFYPSTNKLLLRDGQWDPFTFSKWKVSTNGTFVESKEVSVNGIVVNIGDIISIGDVKLRVEGY